MTIQTGAREIEEESRKSIPFPAEFELSALMFQPLLFREKQAKAIVEKIVENEFSEDIAVNSISSFKNEGSCRDVHDLLKTHISDDDMNTMKEIGYKIIEFGAFSWVEVLHALKIFKLINGHVDVPLDYVIDIGNFETTYAKIDPSVSDESNKSISSDDDLLRIYEEVDTEIINDLRSAAAYSLNSKYLLWKELEKQKIQKDLGFAKACGTYGPIGGLIKSNSWKDDSLSKIALNTLNLTVTPTISIDAINDISTGVEKIQNKQKKQKRKTAKPNADQINLQIVSVNISNLPIYAECLHGLRLGHAVASLRVGDIDGLEDPERRAALDKLGFIWFDKEKYLRFRFVPLMLGLQIYRRHHQHTLIPFEFTVPEAPHWPIWMYNMPLGLWSNIVRIQQRLIAEQYPNRKEMLDDMKILWWVPPDSRVPNCYYEDVV